MTLSDLEMQRRMHQRIWERPTVNASDIPDVRQPLPPCTGTTVWTDEPVKLGLIARIKRWRRGTR